MSPAQGIFLGEIASEEMPPGRLCPYCFYYGPIIGCAAAGPRGTARKARRVRSCEGELTTKRPIMLAVAVILLTGPATGLFGADWVQMKTPGNMFALGRDTGAVLAVNVKSRTATLYPAKYIDGKNKTVVGPVEIAAGACDVLFKHYKGKGYFVICFADSSQVFVLDAATLKIESRITIKERVNSTIATGLDPDDPYVYYIDEKSSRCGWISMETREWAGSARSDDNTHMAVSADGQYMYCRHCRVSPTGFWCHRKVVDPATGMWAWAVVLHEHTSVPQYVPGPFSRYCAVGTNLYSVDLRRKVTALDFAPRCFFRTSPAIVGLAADNQLVAASYNTFKIFSRVKLPAGFLGKSSGGSYRGRYSAGPLVCMADDANRRVVLVSAQGIMTRTLKDLKVPDEPLLLCDVKGPQNLIVGTGAAFTVALLDKRCKVKLTQGPQGMKLSGGKITWTPGIDQVGPAAAVLEISAAKLKVSQTIRMNVARPYVALSFTPSGMQVSPDGTRAVVWSGARTYDGKPQPVRLALIDLEKMQILAGRTLPYSVRTAAVDANFVYVAPAEADRINALDLKDLARKNYTITDSAVTELVVVGSKRLVAGTASHGPRVYEVPKLKAVDSPLTGPPARSAPYASVVARMYYRQGSTAMPFRIGKNWYAAGCLFGPGLTSARMLICVGGITTVGDDRRRPQPIIPLPWNRILRGTELLSRTEQRIARFDGVPTAILPGAPVAASLTSAVSRARTRGYGYSSARSAALTLRELVSGKVVRKMLLMSGVPVPSGRSGGNPRPLVAASGTKVIAVAGQRLFVHAVSAETLKQCPAPFDFQPLDEIPMLDPAKATVVKHKTVGGATPIEFEILGAQKEIEIDTKTGAVTIDGPALAKAAYAKLLADVQKRVNIYDTASANQTPRQIVAEIARKAATQFKSCTGKTPKGIPVLVPVRIAATDKHQQVASMQYQAVIDLSQAGVLKTVGGLIAQAKKQRAEQQRKLREEQERRRAEYEARRRAAGQAVEPEAIKKLERRIEKLEAKVDILIELLRKRKGQ